MKKLPKDLIEYLQQPANRTIIMSQGEVRKAVFFSPEKIKKQKFDVNSYEFYLNGPLKKDPEETREYEGYDLLKEAGSYQPEGVFVWFPEFKAYGSWDCDHHKIVIYPGVSWTEIAKDPTWYINGQWYPENISYYEINPWVKD